MIYKRSIAYLKKDWEGAHEDINDIQSIGLHLPVFTPQNMSKKEFKKRLVDFQRKLYSAESIEMRSDKCYNPMFQGINYATQMDYCSPELNEWAEK